MSNIQTILASFDDKDIMIDAFIELLSVECRMAIETLEKLGRTYDICGRCKQCSKIHQNDSYNKSIRDSLNLS